MVTNKSLFILVGFSIASISSTSSLIEKEEPGSKIVPQLATQSMNSCADDRLQLLKELESSVTGKRCVLPIVSFNEVLHYRKDVGVLSTANHFRFRNTNPNPPGITRTCYTICAGTI